MYFFGKPYQSCFRFLPVNYVPSRHLLANHFHRPKESVDGPAFRLHFPVGRRGRRLCSVPVTHRPAKRQRSFGNNFQITVMFVYFRD